MRPKVRLLLDVDGVINAVTSTPGDFWQDWRTDKVNGFDITWSPAVRDFIVALHERGVEVVWLTTWGATANHHLALTLELPEFPVAGEPYDYTAERDWWKLLLAQDIYERDLVPFVWIDDDIKYEPAAVEWLRSLPHERFLAVSPDSLEGVHPRHVERITAFVDRFLETKLEQAVPE